MAKLGVVPFSPIVLTKTDVTGQPFSAGPSDPSSIRRQRTFEAHPSVSIKRNVVISKSSSFSASSREYTNKENLRLTAAGQLLFGKFRLSIFLYTFEFFFKCFFLRKTMWLAAWVAIDILWRTPMTDSCYISAEEEEKTDLIFSLATGTTLEGWRCHPATRIYDDILLVCDFCHKRIFVFLRKS